MIFRIGDGGLMVCVNGRCAGAMGEDIEKGLLEIAAHIKHDYKNGFET